MYREREASDMFEDYFEDDDLEEVDSEEDDFASEEEMAMLRAIDEYMKFQEGEVAVINPKKIQEFEEAYELVNALLEEDKTVSIKYEKHKPSKNMGYIEVRGKFINFADSEWFYEVGKRCDIIDAMPLNDGNITLCFTFCELTTKIQ